MFAYNENTISDQIHTKWAGKTVHFAKETDSTNLWIKRLAKEGAPQGTLALAEFQEEDVLDAPGRYRKEPP